MKHTIYTLLVSALLTVSAFGATGDFFIYETYNSSGGYQPQIGIAISEPDGPGIYRYTVWKKHDGGRWATVANSYDRTLTFDAGADTTWYVRIQTQSMKNVGGRLVTVTTPFDSSPTELIHVKGAGMIDPGTIDVDYLSEITEQAGGLIGTFSTDDTGETSYAVMDSTDHRIKVIRGGNWIISLGDSILARSDQANSKLLQLFFITDPGPPISQTERFSVDTDGDVNIAGDVTMAAGKLVDNVDISAFADSVRSHAATHETGGADPLDVLELETLESVDGQILVFSSGASPPYTIDASGHTIDDMTLDTELSAHAANDSTLHIPDPAGETDKYLKSDGSVAVWAVVDSAGGGGAHASTHESGGSDTINVLALTTSDGRGDDFLALSSGASPPFTVVSSGYSADSFAAAAKGVTNGDSHDHAGGDGAQIPLASGVTGTLPIANGGTNTTSYANETYLRYDSGTASIIPSGESAASFAAASHNHSGVYAPVSHDILSSHTGFTAYDGDKVVKVNVGSSAFELDYVDYSSLTSVPSTFTPSNHNFIDTTKHPVSGLTTGHFLKATGATSYGFAAHGLTYSDVGAAASAHNHAASNITSGSLAQARGGLGVDVSGFTGFLKMTSGSTPSAASAISSSDMTSSYPDGSTLPFVTAVRFDSAAMTVDIKTRAVTISNGVITTLGAESGWTNVNY